MIWKSLIGPFITALLLSSVITTAVPSFARDSFGLIDLTGKEIIPCKYKSLQYVGCGLYIAEEMPNATTQPSGAELLSFVPKDLLAFIANHEWYSAKILLSRNGKRISVPIPRDAVLTRILLHSKEEQWDFDKHERPAVSNNGKIPHDALLHFVSKKGFGLCNGVGEVLVEPNTRALEKAKKQDGFLLDLYSEGRMFHPKETKKVAKPQVKLERKQFSEGLTICSKEGLWYFANRSGKKVSPTYEFAKPFVDGIALVGDKPARWINRNRTSWDCYFIDRNFKRISPKYYAATEFHGRYALVTLLNPGRQEVGLIDKNFNYSFVCYDDRDCSFASGVWILRHPIAPTICLDKNGQKLFTTPEVAWPKRFTNSILTFHSLRSGNWFFYDRKGNRLPPLNVRTSMYDPEYFPLAVTTNDCEWKAGKGILGTQYQWLLKPDVCDLQITERNRCIKTIYGKFEKEDWLQPDDNRYREFYAFLRAHNPIGMTKDEVEYFLGPGTAQRGKVEQDQDAKPDPNIVSYQLNWFGAWCASSTWFAEFRYDNSRVKEWRIYKRTERINPWIRS